MTRFLKRFLRSWNLAFLALSVLLKLASPMNNHLVLNYHILKSVSTDFEGLSITFQLRLPFTLTMLTDFKIILFVLIVKKADFI